MLPNMKVCEKCGKMYPQRFDMCPTCNSNAQSDPLRMTEDQINKAIESSLNHGDIDETQVKK